jgi:hypothetical protein
MRSGKEDRQVTAKRSASEGEVERLISDVLFGKT